MVGHGGSSAGSYLTDPTSPIPSHCASIVGTSTLRVKLTIYLNPLVTFGHFTDMEYTVHQKFIYYPKLPTPLWSDLLARNNGYPKIIHHLEHTKSS